jgi:hypothetical protein
VPTWLPTHWAETDLFLQIRVKKYSTHTDHRADAWELCQGTGTTRGQGTVSPFGPATLF